MELASEHGYFIIAVVCAIISGITHVTERPAALTASFFMLAGLSTALHFALLDPFLHTWDEQFHALVAKRLAENPFKPLLYTGPMADLNNLNWAGSSIWLHKQPMFLWLMAASIKLFGNTVLAARLPSIVMHGLLSVMMYRSGKLVLSPMLGWCAAVLFTFGRYPLELVSGFHASDHNDMAILFFVTASLWAWLEYQREGTWRWTLLIALFSAMAVLTKWMVGLLVYGGWLASIVVSKNHRDWRPWATALATTIALVFPWQVYVFLRFPSHASHEFSLNAQHLWVAVEGHGGDALFHFRHFKLLYGAGDLMPWLFLLGLAALLWRLKNQIEKAIFLVSIGVAVYAVFSFSATKMPAFPLVVAMVVYFGLAMVFIELGNRLFTRFLPEKWSSAVIALSILVAALIWNNPFTVASSRIHQLPTYALGKEHHLQSMKALRSLELPLADENYVIYNVNIGHFDHISWMYLRDFSAVFPHVPNEAEVQRALENNLVPVCLQHRYAPIPCPRLEGLQTVSIE